jgi:DNA (cytosine-5)-methyltransferase 1
MAAYYNEIDPNAAEWLRQLIKAGQIAPGDVDERSIEDVTPDELAAYTQCHFFAGIGGWSLALRMAGWLDDKPVWTGSAPCQPFSAAGKKGGTADERHLWPALFWLISQCRPEVVIGEQVASKDGLGWWDVVSADLEGTGYACGAFDLCAPGVGAFHIRQRLYWVAHSELRGCQCKSKLSSSRPQQTMDSSARIGISVGSHSSGSSTLADSKCPERGPITPGGKGEQHGAIGERQAPSGSANGGETGPLAHSSSERRQQDPRSPLGHEAADGRTGRHGGEPNPDHQPSGDGENGGIMGNSNRRGEYGGAEISQETWRGQSSDSDNLNPWADPIWLPCADGKARPVEPSIQPLVNGLPRGVGYSGDISPQTAQNTAEGRVMRLKGYGNAIVPHLAAEFVSACMESLG